MGEGERREERAARRRGGKERSEERAAQLSLFWETDGHTKFKKKSRENPHFARFDKQEYFGYLL